MMIWKFHWEKQVENDDDVKAAVKFLVHVLDGTVVRHHFRPGDPLVYEPGGNLGLETGGEYVSHAKRCDKFLHTPTALEKFILRFYPATLYEAVLLIEKCCHFL